MKTGIGILITMWIILICLIVLESCHPAKIQPDGTGCRLDIDGQVVTFTVSPNECIRLQKLQQEKTK